MLPGFRFLFTAVVLSMSILVFGLGAAALLRASHEKFASFPSLRPPPEPMFTRQNDLVPTLALMRVDPAEVEKKVDDIPATAAPEIAPDILEPAAQAPDANPAVSETLAAVKPEEPILVEAPAPEIPPTEAIAETPAAPAEIEAPVAEAEAPLEAIAATPAAPLPETGAPAAEEEAKLAATAETPEPPAANAPPLAEPATNVLSLQGNIAASTIATPGGPAVVVDEKTSAKTADAKPDSSAVKKRISQRARERRRIARRAQLEREAALAAQQRQADPFGLLTPVAPRTR